MGAFNTKALFNGNYSLIPSITEAIEKHFIDDGYQTKVDTLISGGIELFVTKGGVFKEVLGMRTALKVTLIPYDNSIQFEAGIGIFGQQFVPTVISMLFAWPVLITQIWGLVQQAKLDDQALNIAKQVITEHSLITPVLDNASKFCTNCGCKVSATAKFCSNCGTKLCSL